MITSGRHRGNIGNWAGNNNDFDVLGRFKNKEPFAFCIETILCVSSLILRYFMHAASTTPSDRETFVFFSVLVNCQLESPINIPQNPRLTSIQLWWVLCRLFISIHRKNWRELACLPMQVTKGKKNIYRNVVTTAVVYEPSSTSQFCYIKIWVYYRTTI